MKIKNKYFYIVKAKVYNLLCYIRMKYTFVDLLYIYITALCRKNTIKEYRPITCKEYCEKTNDEYTSIETEQKRNVFVPAYYKLTDGKFYCFESPEIYVAKIKNVFVHGGTGIITDGIDSIFDACAKDNDFRGYYSFGSLRRGDRNKIYLEVSHKKINIQKAVNLCGFASHNYYHLTVEILSRFEYVKNFMDSETVILLDQDSKKFSQFQELINTVLPYERVVYVPRYALVNCEELIFPSLNTWMPLNVVRKDLFKVSDNLIAKTAVTNIRDSVSKYFKSPTSKKVYISRRNALVSRIQNAIEVEKLFRDNGFEIVCTEDMTYKEQVELFSSASCIVGASGAALTNLIYCNPGTVFGCIIPKQYNFYIYSTIADIVGCKMLFFNPEISKETPNIATDEYHIDLDECERYIRELNNLQSEND